LKQVGWSKGLESVLRRDGGRCQFCGSRLSLEVHHQHFRSHSGEDMEENLIALCANCHSVAHGTVRQIRIVMSTLSTYVKGFHQSRFVIDDIVVPTVEVESLARFPELADEKRVPNFVIFILTKPM